MRVAVASIDYHGHIQGTSHVALYMSDVDPRIRHLTQPSTQPPSPPAARGLLVAIVGCRVRVS